MSAFTETPTFNTTTVGTAGLSRTKLGTRTAAIVRELVAERHRQHLSAREVIARMAGTWSIAALQHAETGNHAPGAEFLLCWAEALGRPLVLSDGAS